MKVFSVAEFAARRRQAQDDAIARLLPLVTRWLNARAAAGQRSGAQRRALLSAILALYRDTYRSEGGEKTPTPTRLLTTARQILLRTPRTGADPRTVATLLVIGTQNAATVQAADDDPEPLLLEWVTMHDTKVRHTHARVEGQQRPPGEKFNVGGEEFAYPGQPVGDPSLWINCRCTLAPVLLSETRSVTETGVAMTDTATETETSPGIPDNVSVPWHGVLAPEGKWSGDGRRFAEGALSTRDLPMPLTWQKVSDEGHKGSVTVATIEAAERVGDEYRATGHFLNSPEADEVVGLLTTFGKFGVSVDADDAEFEYDDNSDKVTFTTARISAASIVQIPAFAEAYVRLGDAPAEFASFAGKPLSPIPGMPDNIDVCNPDSPDYDQRLCDERAPADKPGSKDNPSMAAKVGDDVVWETGPTNMRHSGRVRSITQDVALVEVVDQDGNATGSTQHVPLSRLRVAGAETVEFVSDTPWGNFSASDYTDAQWEKACVLDRGADAGTAKQRFALPILEPSGALNRNGVHSAAAALAGARGGVNASPAAKSAAASRLRSAYSQIGETPPDSLKAESETEEFRRGPGWITNPEDTRRIHDYWTVPGHAGYAKIAWGTPGDFDRCRVEIGQEIAENDPATVARYMNQICAQWHHDATGFWPGHAPAERGTSAETEGFGNQADPAPAVSLAASADVHRAPAAWFTDPHLTEPTHLTVDAEGRVFGHLAAWGTCHIGFDGVCVEPPNSNTGYAYYANKQVLLDDGTSARTGVISIGGGHANGRATLRSATEHYDNTCTAVADVSVGEDEHGIWCAGWVRPGATDAQVAALRASDVSGDWREVGGNLEMVAALAVNTAGFPVARVTEGVQVALVAAGIVASPADDLDAIADLIVNKIEARAQAQKMRKQRLTELVTRVRSSNGM